MRKLLIIGSLFLVPAIVLAQLITIEKSVECEKTEVVFRALMNTDFNEKPIWVGKDENSNYSLFVNDKTKTWTLVQFTEKYACILGAGDKSKLLLTAIKSSI